MPGNGRDYRVSRELIRALKRHRLHAYEVALEAGIPPMTFYKLYRGIFRPSSWG